MVFSFSLNAKILVKCFEISTTKPSPTHCPANDVPAARGISVMLFLAANFTSVLLHNKN